MSDKTCIAVHLDREEARAFDRLCAGTPRSTILREMICKACGIAVKKRRAYARASKSISVDMGEPEEAARPAIDPLLEKLHAVHGGEK